jgi:hypothetical protein
METTQHALPSWTWLSWGQLVVELGSTGMERWKRWMCYGVAVAWHGEPVDVT